MLNLLANIAHSTTLRITSYCTRGFAVLAFIGMVGCQASAPRQMDHDRQPTAQPAMVPDLPAVEKTPSSVETPAIIESPVVEDIGNRWVYPLQYKKGSTGGLVRGSFDPKRNKIMIDTQDVKRFRIDMTKLSINWDRLVIIRLNGKSSELRRRDSDVIDFEIDKYGNWVVFEP